MSAARRTSQGKTLEAFIENWRKLSVDGMASLFSPSWEFYGLPAAVLGSESKTRDQWAGYVKPMWGELSNFHIELLSTVNDGDTGRAVLHAKTSAELPVMPYRNEHIMILHFSGDGSKITKLEDMMDSVFAIKLQTTMTQYFKDKAQS